MASHGIYMYLQLRKNYNNSHFEYNLEEVVCYSSIY